MPAIVFPDLMYSCDVVIEVIVGRLGGQPASDFAPDRRTQKRWLERINEAWPIAQCVGAIRGTLADWTQTPSKLKEAILRCATRHVGLFFPSHGFDEVKLEHDEMSFSYRMYYKDGGYYGFRLRMKTYREGYEVVKQFIDVDGREIISHGFEHGWTKKEFDGFVSQQIEEFLRWSERHGGTASI